MTTTNHIGAIMAKMETILAQAMPVGRILVSPSFHHELMLEMAGYYPAFEPRAIERIVGIPVVVVRDVHTFEVSIR